MKENRKFRYAYRYYSERFRLGTISAEVLTMIGLLTGRVMYAILISCNSAIENSAEDIYLVTYCS